MIYIHILRHTLYSELSGNFVCEQGGGGQKCLPNPRICRGSLRSYKFLIPWAEKEMACIEPREAVRCFNKHERFPLSHLYFIFAHVSPLLSISFLSFSFRQPPECVKKNSFTYLLYTTTYNIVQYAPFSPPPSPPPFTVCVFSSHHHSRAYLPSLRTSSINHLDFWSHYPDCLPHLP